jgi:hypothetical protein
VLDHVLHALFERDDQQRNKVDEQNGPEHGHVQETEQRAGECEQTRSRGIVPAYIAVSSASKRGG